MTSGESNKLDELSGKGDTQGLMQFISMVTESINMVQDIETKSETTVNKTKTEAVEKRTQVKKAWKNSYAKNLKNFNFLWEEENLLSFQKFVLSRNCGFFCPIIIWKRKFPSDPFTAFQEDALTFAFVSLPFSSMTRYQIDPD